MGWLRCEFPEAFVGRARVSTLSLVPGAFLAFYAAHELLGLFLFLLIEEDGVPLPLPGDTLIIAAGARTGPTAASLLGPWRLIAVDHRGHGLSGTGSTPYQRGDLVRDYVELIRALGLERPIIVGHSLGAWVGMSLAGTPPSLVGGLVLGDMSPQPRRTATAERSQRMRAAYEPGVGDATWADEEEAFQSLRAANPQETDDEVRVRIRHQLQRTAAGGLERARSPVVALSIFEEVAEANLWPLLPRIDVPTRVVFAERSDVLGRADAERMVRELSRGN